MSSAVICNSPSEDSCQPLEDAASLWPRGRDGQSACAAPRPRYTTGQSKPIHAVGCLASPRHVNWPTGPVSSGGTNPADRLSSAPWHHRRILPACDNSGKCHRSDLRHQRSSRRTVDLSTRRVAMATARAVLEASFATGRPQRHIASGPLLYGPQAVSDRHPRPFPGGRKHRVVNRRRCASRTGKCRVARTAIR